MNNQIIQNKFQQGKIYELVNLINGYKYKGSTIKELSKRGRDHDAASKLGTSPLYEAMRTHGTANFRISLVKNYPCNSKIELEAEEAKVIAAARVAGEQLYNNNRPAVIQTPEIIIMRAHTAAWAIANANKYQCKCCQYATSAISNLERHLKSVRCQKKMPTYLLEQEIKRLNEIVY